MGFRGPRARRDLEYTRQVVEGDEVMIVRDPIRNTYFKFNELQAAMLRELDGTKTAAEVADTLGEEYETEIPAAAIERFISRARDLMLLEVTEYTETPEAARKLVHKALRKAGFRARSPSTARPLSAESTRFAEALRQLELGAPRAAAAYFAEILATNPDNRRARQLYDLIQSAYIKSSYRTTDYPTWVIFNPANLLTWISRKFGWFLFSVWGVLAIIAYTLVGAYAYSLIDFATVTTSAFDIILAVTFVLVIHPLFHELGHGLACQHYGGNVTEVGYILFYYFKPAAFCDTSSSYLIASRRHKVIVQLAGTVASILTLASTSMMVALLSPEVPIYSGFALGLMVSSVFMFVTLLPFLKLDGYYALADGIGFPNLRERAFKATKAFFANKLLGLELQTEDHPPRTRRWLIVYGVTARIFTMCFILFIYTRFVVTPLVERFSGTGLLFAIGLSIYLWRNVAVKPLFNSMKTLVRERRKIFTLRRTARLIGLATLVIGPWCIPWPLLVDSEFEIKPAARAEVRSRTGGRVVEIAVAEGSRVREGDVLAKLVDAKLSLRIAKLVADREVALRQLDVAAAGARDEELAVARTRVAQARAEVATTAARARAARELAAARLGVQDTADAAGKRMAAQAGALGAARGAMAVLEAGPRIEDVRVARAELERVEAELAHLRHEEELLVLRAPIDGVVVTPHVADKLQSTLAPGDLFVELHDVDRVVAEIPLAQSDPLSEISVGDEVALKLHAAPEDDHAVEIANFKLSTTTTRDGRPRVVAVTEPFRLERAQSGLTGHARIYGEEHTLAYAHIYVPVQRLVNVTLWSMY